jgi:AmmeMemoRadiSam system protein A
MTVEISKNEKAFLLKLARRALEVYFETGDEMGSDWEGLNCYMQGEDTRGEGLENLKKEAATFVTLTIDGELRGCIGKLEADQELYKDVIENVYLAAFNDSRFDPLNEKELSKVKIEVSILTAPIPLEYNNQNDLLEKISKTKPGLLIKSGFYQATFLPQVWEDLPNPEEFLNHLCQKAGLKSDHWNTSELDIMQYEVIHFSE